MTTHGNEHAKHDAAASEAGEPRRGLFEKTANERKHGNGGLRGQLARAHENVGKSKQSRL